MSEIIRIDVSDRTIKEDRELLTYRLKEFMQENMTNEEELIELLRQD